MFTCGWAWPTRWPICPISGFWGGAKFRKMWDSLSWTPMNRRAKCDAASFILGGEIRKRTNKQTNTQTHKETVTDISTPCLPPCVDKKTSDNGRKGRQAFRFFTDSSLSCQLAARVEVLKSRRCIKCVSTALLLKAKWTDRRQCRLKGCSPWKRCGHGVVWTLSFLTRSVKVR